MLAAEFENGRNEVGFDFPSQRQRTRVSRPKAADGVMAGSLRKGIVHDIATPRRD
jgi:hypothetical protein